MTNHNQKLTSRTQKHLELVRRLENSSHLFATSPKSATATAKQIDGTPMDKLIKRATLIDSDGKLKSALQKSKFLVSITTQFYSTTYFLMGFLGVLGLLSTHFISFFYVLVGLLGYHTLTLLVWLVGLQRPHNYSLIYVLLDKLKPKKPVEKTAFEIHVEEFKLNDRFKVGAIIHRAWLFGLAGSLLALLMLFSFKSYDFVWESTLLNQTHFAQILATLGALPQLAGFDVPTFDELSQKTATPASLAILMMASVVFYGMLPRFCAYVYCVFYARKAFRIDQNLYYYQSLLRQFNQDIINKDDYTPSTPKVAKPISHTHTKVVATLERIAPSNWYHLDAGHTIKEIGVLDNKDDLTHAINTTNELKAQLHLGIDLKSLPDRGMLRKFDTLLQDCQYGVVVEFFGEGEHLAVWQDALNARAVPIIAP
ncbi:MAG: DUF2868 domain-containing protein [Moraxella sp.]|nr:DUF2868 domain-containing protein [Moraxella sp.]